MEAGDAVDLPETLPVREVRGFRLLVLPGEMRDLGPVYHAILAAGADGQWHKPPKMIRPITALRVLEARGLVEMRGRSPVWQWRLIPPTPAT